VNLVIASQGPDQTSSLGFQLDPPLVITGGLTPPVATSLVLQSGNNTIAVPSGAVGVFIIPPLGQAIVLLFKTSTTDTGVNIRQGTPSLFLFDTSNLPANIIINAASTATGWTQVLFF